MAVKCTPHKHSSGKEIAKGATRLWKGATRLHRGRPRGKGGDQTVVQEQACDRPSLLELISCAHEQSRGPYVTSQDQLCLSATRRGPEGTTRVKVLSHNLSGSIRAYKYKHTTTSARSTRPCLVLYDHRSKHQTEVVPHDQCGLTPLKQRDPYDHTLLRAV